MIDGAGTQAVLKVDRVVDHVEHGTMETAGLSLSVSIGMVAQLLTRQRHQDRLASGVPVHREPESLLREEGVAAL